MKLREMVLATFLLSQLSFCVLAQSQLNILARQNSSTLPPGPAIQKQGLQGIWQGTLETGGTKLRVIFKVTKSPNHTFAATLDVPDQGATGVPIDAVTVKDATVRFEFKSLSAVYEGMINKEGTAITGNWSQGGMTVPLTLNRSDKAPSASLRPQEPKKPYPYDEEEVSYENKRDGVRLAGTLTLPRTKGPHPAVLLITGSGKQDRNESLLGHKPFLVLSDYLTRRGIAVLRVDDRGVGGSTGDGSFDKTTSENFAEDVLAGVAFLKTRRDINPRQIGLIGHSEGGIIAPLAAARSVDVAFIVLMAGPGVTGEEGFPNQLSSTAKASGASDESIAWNRRLLLQMFSIIKEEKDNAAADKKIRELRAKMLAEMSEEQRKKYGIPVDAMDGVIKLMLTPWFRFYLTHDPRATLKKVRVPVLAITGERDLQVVPAGENLAAIAEALKAGGNKDSTVVEVPKLNHLFQTSETGSPAEYGRIEETISPDVLRLIGDWIVKRTAPMPSE
ncbi:MAG: alpha/beta hydrolase family protein [Pyrinomonadaceae bacterium]